MPEVGFQQVKIDAPDEQFFEGLEPQPTVFQWHGDTFDLPSGGLRLASSDTCTNQAFRWGSAAFGLQFHVETTREQIMEWAAIPAYRQALVQLYGSDGPERLLREAEAHLDKVHDAARLMFRNFCRIAESAKASD